MNIKHSLKIAVGKFVAFRYRYDKRYLCGRWFSKENNYIGWNWVINNSRNCRKLKVNQNVKFPVSPQIRITNGENIDFHPDDLCNFQHFGCYFQSKGKIVIGRGTYIAPNVGIITSNHDTNNLDKHEKEKSIIIGEECWIGMNAMILPGVELGHHTVVGAGSVVTKSFKEGNCIVAGNPATIIKYLNINKNQIKGKNNENNSL